jgi:hypothetical protein
MISRFWLGECVWDINVVLWQNFGKEILVFDQVMRLERIEITVHGACHPGPGGLSAASARTVRAAPVAAPAATPCPVTSSMRIHAHL